VGFRLGVVGEERIEEVEVADETIISNTSSMLLVLFASDDEIIIGNTCSVLQLKRVVSTLIVKRTNITQNVLEVVQ
jgi:hypothetical protein